MSTIRVPLSMLTPKAASRARHKGLTLIEVLVALLIFSFITMSMLSLFTQGYRLVRKSRMGLMAYLLAQEKMEELLDANAVFPNPQSHNETKQAVPGFSGFQRQVNFTCPPPGLASPTYDNVSLVNVTVYWNATARERSFSLVSMVSTLTD